MHITLFFSLFRLAAFRRMHGVLAITALMLQGAAHAREPLDCLIEPNLLVEVSSSEVGVLERVSVDESDVVRKGQVIAALRTDVERSVLKLSRARASAAAEIELLRSDYEFNQRKQERVERLHNQRVVSAQNVDEVRTAQEVAQLRWQAAIEKQRTVQHEAERDALSLARRIVHSPIDGVVVRRHKAAGEYVEGDPIVQLVQLDPLRVRVVAPIAMFGTIKVGAQATVTPELPIAGPFMATVMGIDPVMDAATATFGVRLSLPNPEHRLPPGLKCTLVLQPEQEQLAATDESPAPKSTPGEVDASDPLPPSSSPSLQETVVPVPPGTSGEHLNDLEPELGSLPVGEPTVLAAAMNEPEATTERASDAGSRSDFCATLGPLERNTDSDRVAAELGKMELQFTRRFVANTAKRPSWMVLSRESFTHPGTTTKRLKRAGVTDYQWLRRGPWKTRFSFGQYRGVEHAKRRVAQMRKLGFDVERVPRGNGQGKSWFDFGLSEQDPMLVGVVRSLRKDYPALDLRSATCPSLASR
jgi:RND family efflux transporter MFP subunit